MHGDIHVSRVYTANAGHGLYAGCTKLLPCEMDGLQPLVDILKMWLRKPQTLPDRATGTHTPTFINLHLVAYLRTWIWKWGGMLLGVMKELEDLLKLIKEKDKEETKGDTKSALQKAHMIWCTHSELDG